MRVLALTFGDANLASSKYRVYQYIEPLREFGIELEPRLANDFEGWASISKYDAVLVQKKLFSTGRAKQLRHSAKRLIYELDDAIWHPHAQAHSWITNLRTHMRLRAITRSANLCLAANAIIAKHLTRWARQVEVIPMALDERTWTARSNQFEPGAKIRIGWAGHPVNVRYVEEIEPALVTIQQKFANAHFQFLSGQAPRFGQLQFEHVPFNPKCEQEAIRGFDIGLLPLPTGAFAEAKSPVKGLQYMASGVATVLSPHGATRDMFEDERTGLFAFSLSDWEQALDRLIGDHGLRQRLGTAARKEFEATYALSRTVPFLANVLSNSVK